MHFFFPDKIVSIIYSGNIVRAAQYTRKSKNLASTTKKKDAILCLLSLCKQVTLPFYMGGYCGEKMNCGSDNKLFIDS